MLPAEAKLPLMPLDVDPAGGTPLVVRVVTESTHLAVTPTGGTGVALLKVQVIVPATAVTVVVVFFTAVTCAKSGSEKRRQNSSLLNVIITLLRSNFAGLPKAGVYNPLDICIVTHPGLGQIVSAGENAQSLLGHKLHINDVEYSIIVEITS